MVVVLIPVAEAETVVLPAAPEVAAGVLAALGVLEDEEPPHAASPTTAAAARTEPANHRLRMYLLHSLRLPAPRSIGEHVPATGIVQVLFDLKFRRRCGGRARPARAGTGTRWRR